MWVVIAWTLEVRWWDLDWAQWRRGDDEVRVEDYCKLKEEEEEYDGGLLVLIIDPLFALEKLSEFQEQWREPNTPPPRSLTNSDLSRPWTPSLTATSKIDGPNLLSSSTEIPCSLAPVIMESTIGGGEGGGAGGCRRFERGMSFVIGNQR
ncbi:uncharacterized protein A4U43_C05F4840 [Asparagus officinalis]|uniref:Uncharacterized protein n=1 Tax=Asparagus officinalis TaxID=4686 RepID=A0A5P1EPF9_ASPOF|nr:uncharacterized protein A4U43_C05F4840 [Asparagus officinalis]